MGKVPRARKELGAGPFLGLGPWALGPGPSLGKNVAKTMVFARLWGPALARTLPKPWFCMVLGPRPGQNVVKTMVFAGYPGPRGPGF